MISWEVAEDLLRFSVFDSFPGGGLVMKMLLECTILRTLMGERLSCDSRLERLLLAPCCEAIEVVRGNAAKSWKASRSILDVTEVWHSHRIDFDTFTDLM